MTYSSAHIVYGIDVTPEGRGSPFARFEELVETLSEQDLVQSAYNGLGDTPYWVGARLGGISPSTTRLKGLRLEPNGDDVAKFEKARKALLDHLATSDEEGAKEFAALVESQVPEVFLAWGSS